MKYIYVFFIVAFSVCATVRIESQGKVLQKEKNPSDTIVLSEILSIPLSSYIGKPVDSLFAVLPAGFTYRGFMPVRVSYNLGVSQSYGDVESNTVLVQVFIDNYQYISFPNRSKSSTWNIGLAKKETISFIKIIKNNTICVYGCNNPNYDY